MFEREAKLSAPAGFRWPVFGAESALVATPLEKRAFQTVYFDTPAACAIAAGRGGR